jgi:hypothetical protein
MLHVILNVKILIRISQFATSGSFSKTSEEGAICLFDEFSCCCSGQRINRELKNFQELNFISNLNMLIINYLHI